MLCVLECVKNVRNGAFQMAEGLHIFMSKFNSATGYVVQLLSFYLFNIKQTSVIENNSNRLITVISYSLHMVRYICHLVYLASLGGHLPSFPLVAHTRDRRESKLTSGNMMLPKPLLEDCTNFAVLNLPAFV